MFKKSIKYIILIVICFSYSYSLYGQDDQKSCTDCHESLIKHEVIHAVAEDACDNCHQSSGAKHPTAKGNEFTLNELVPDLCYMCHDGINTKKNIHAPITDGYCMMCHSAHASPNNALLIENPAQKLCYMCHDLEIPKTDNMHTPVKKGNCQECHDPHQSDNSTFLKNTKPQLCFKCHENVKNEAGLDNIHYPFDDDCATCHKPHSSSEDYLMTEKTPTLCFNCHDDFTAVVATMKSSHSILFDKKNCANCHSPHASAYNSMLKKDSKDVCLTCHSRTIKSDSIRVENIGRNIKRGKSVHAALEMDGCATCHKPHFSEYESLLKGNYPSGKYTSAKVENFGICFDCHDSGLLESAITTDATNFRTGDINMHFLHIKGKKGRTCSLCHDMHASGNEHLILEKSKFGSWEMTMNYKVTSSGGSCFPGCHGEKSYIR